LIPDKGRDFIFSAAYRLDLGLINNSLLGTRGKCALGEMAESYGIGLRDYTIPTIGTVIIATGIVTCKTCANLKICKCTVGRKFIRSV
jgi:hypothetical protein